MAIKSGTFGSVGRAPRLRSGRSRVLKENKVEEIFKYISFLNRRFNAEVAQLVERNLAKVEVAGSSLVFRSKKFHPFTDGIFCFTKILR